MEFRIGLGAGNARRTRFGLTTRCCGRRGHGLGRARRPCHFPPRVTHFPESPIGSPERKNEEISTALAESAPLGHGGAGVSQGGSGATAAPRRQGAF
jgi:hypothetical protein